MSDEQPRFDAESVAADWNYGADAYAEFQASGNDHYRYEFFGPAQIAMCGAVVGLRVLDLGCGNGYLSRAMAERGAIVAGLDISPGQIRHARRIEGEGPLNIDYRVGDAAEAATMYDPGSFDMVVSCVALQDMPRPEQVIRAAYAVLRPGGRFVACIVHPTNDTPYREWERGGEGGKRALKIDHYFRRAPVEYAWRAPVQPYDWTSIGYHATLSDWMTWFLDAGFELRALKEPEPGASALERHPELEDAARIPYFLLLDWIRRG